MAKPSGPALRFSKVDLIEAPLASHVDCIHRAPVAQLDRAVASGATGREFESLRAHHSFSFKSHCHSSRLSKSWRGAVGLNPIIGRRSRRICVLAGAIILLKAPAEQNPTERKYPLTGSLDGLLQLIGRLSPTIHSSRFGLPIECGVPIHSLFF